MGCSGSTLPTTVNEIKISSAKPFCETYLLGVKLGRGAFAQVRIASKVELKGHTNSGREKAVKILDLRGKDDPTRMDAVMQKTAQQEVNIWNVVGHHDTCIRLYETFFEGELCFMVMEKCLCGVFQYLDSMAELNERTIGCTFAQMLCGIAHCHSVRVIHRDIKPDNFLVGGEDGKTIKLGDFGLSTTFPKGGKVTGVFGTAPFMCPEMVKGCPYNEKADVWSMAVIAYALLFGKFPYVPKEQSSKAMKKAIVEAAPVSFEPAGNSVQQRSESAVEFVKALLDRDTDTRPSAEEALSLTFMVSVIENDHMPGSELPSLRSTLYASKKVGAFEARDVCKETSIDRILHTMQMTAHGVPLPEVSAPDKKTQDGSRKGKSADISPSPRRTISSLSANAMVTSNSSNLWDNTSTNCGSSTGAYSNVSKNSQIRSKPTTVCS